MLYDYKCLQTFLVPPKGFYSQMLTPTFQKVTIIESLRAIASTYIWIEHALRAAPIFSGVSLWPPLREDCLPNKFANSGPRHCSREGLLWRLLTERCEGGVWIWVFWETEAQTRSNVQISVEETPVRKNMEWQPWKAETFKKFCTWRRRAEGRWTCPRCVSWQGHPRGAEGVPCAPGALPTVVYLPALGHWLVAAMRGMRPLYEPCLGLPSIALGPQSVMLPVVAARSLLMASPVAIRVRYKTMCVLTMGRASVHSEVSSGISIPAAGQGAACTLAPSTQPGQQLCFLSSHLELLCDFQGQASASGMVATFALGEGDPLAFPPKHMLPLSGSSALKLMLQSPHHTTMCWLPLPCCPLRVCFLPDPPRRDLRKKVGFVQSWLIFLVEYIIPWNPILKH